MAPPAQTPSGAMGAIIISIKLVAISIAIAMTILLIYGFGFRWYTALAVGVVGYIAAKPVLGIVIGYFWGREDARELKQYVASLPPDVKRDLLDNAPTDVKERVADVLKSVPPAR
jgi:hypothetical protein